MKSNYFRLFLFTSALFLSGYTLSQRLTVNDMFLLINKDFDEIDTYLLKKGYVFKPGSDSKKEDTKNNCAFFYEYSHKSIKYYDFAMYNCIYDGNTTNLTVRTSSESDYLKFKDELKIKGFKHLKSYVENQTNFIEYELIQGETTYEATLTSRIINGSISIYEIGISKK